VTAPSESVTRERELGFHIRAPVRLSDDRMSIDVLLREGVVLTLAYSAHKGLPK
jgi:hypothetical protein